DFNDFVLQFQLNGSGGYLVGDGCPTANWETYGVGCPPATPLSVDAAPGSLPRLGEQFLLVPTNVGPGGAAVAALHLGLTESSIELSIIGMPDCYLLSSVEASIPLLLVEGLSFPYNVGSDPGLLGTTFRIQPIALQAGANPLGVVTSNAGRMTFGY
ncbi:MAG: hypothetical protein KDB80_00265, partial [Planctomycetes bacterium]|nr:hypothetical protein [Planctomycetota bacterium]